MSTKVRQNVLPVIAAFIWGVAFVAQSVGADYIGPFTFNTIRFLLGGLVLVLLMIVMSRFEKPEDKKNHGSPKDIIKGGLACGVALSIAANLQQMGLSEASAGKAGFITALYIVIVPVLGLFLKKKVPPAVWVSIVLAVAGLYFLCITEGFKIEVSDFYLLLCALIYAVHILVIDHYSQKVSGVRLSFAQFVVACLISAVGMLMTEHPTFEAIKLCAVPLLYVGIFSSGVAYTLQIVAQKGSNPTIVSLLLSLESVFSVTAGALILHETLTGREFIGCVLMLIAVVLVQLPIKYRVTKPDKVKIN